MGKKKKQEYDRKCLACGEIHLEGMCPIIKRKVEKYMESSKKNFFWGNVLLECIRKKADFCQLLFEVAEEVEEMEMFLRGRFVNGTLMPIESAVEYIAVSLNTSSKKFYRSSEKTAEEYVEFLGKSDLVEEWCDNEGDEINYITFTFENEKYREAKILNKKLSFWLNDYQFVLTKNFNGENDYVYELKVTLPITIMSDSESSTIKKLYPKGRSFWWENLFGASGNEILLLSEREGMLQEYFEKTIGTFWSLDSLIEDRSYMDTKFYLWVRRLEEQTRKGIIEWRKRGQFYFSECENTDVEIKVNNTSNQNRVFLYIRCLNGLGIRFGNYEENSEDKEQYISQKKRLQSLVELIEQSIIEEKNRLMNENLRTRELKHTDLVEVVYSMTCHTEHHKLVPCRGIIPMLTTDNKQIKYEVYVGFCVSCNKYYMFHSDYEEMLKSGKPLCAVYNANKVGVGFNKVPFKYKSQSALNAMGYTVSVSGNLEKEERQDILKKALDSQIFEVSDLVNFLNWLIQTREPQLKYRAAVQKWMEDLMFVKEYKSAERNVVNVGAIEAR